MDADMVTMMMNQMEKLPEFYDASNPHTGTVLAGQRDHQQIHFSNLNASSLSPSSSSDSPPQYMTLNPQNNPISLGSSNPIPQEPVVHPKYRQSPVFPGMSSSPYLSGGLCRSSNDMAAMREMIFRIAVMQPIHIDPESIKPPKRRNVKISKDPQSVAARHRRERISERIRILQRLVPGGTKMDTASMLDEAIHYVKFLKKQVQTLEEQAATGGGGVKATATLLGSPSSSTVNDIGLMSGLAIGGNGVSGGYNSNPLGFKACGQMPGCHQMVGNIQMLR